MRRVLVIENQRLLGAGIENLLRQEADLQVFGVASQDEETLLQAIDRYHPTVVVLDGAWVDVNRLSVLFQDRAELLLVVASADDDLVRTFEQRHVTIVHAADLVALIRG